MPIVRSLPMRDPRRAGFEIEGLPGGTARCTFEADAALDQSGHAWLPASLPILMASAEDAEFTDLLDPTGRANAGPAQDVLAKWYPNLRHVDIRGESGHAGSTRTGVGCFFSGGVDSFYSVLERRDEITHLIFVHGFDIALENEQVAQRASAAVRDAARDLGIQLITLRTDLRRVSDRWSQWGHVYHGAALAAAGLLLADHVGRVIIPSTFHTDHLPPWGSHPDLDPLWSTSRVMFEHHGVEMHRTQKIAALVSDPVAMRYLRVCWQQEAGEYNCGRCPKCIRTMATLRAYDALEDCATFPSRIDPRPLAAVRDPQPFDVADAKSILALLAARQVDEPELVRQLRGLVRRDTKWWRALRRVRARLRRISRTVA